MKDKTEVLTIGIPLSYAELSAKELSMMITRAVRGGLHYTAISCSGTVIPRSVRVPVDVSSEIKRTASSEDITILNLTSAILNLYR